MLYKTRFLVLSFLILVTLIPALGQDATAEPSTTEEPSTVEYTTIAEGLYSPRQLFIAQDGTLFIAEAGMGGEVTAPSIQGGGEALVGLSSQITTVSPDGEQSVLLDNLFSINESFSIYGVQAVYADETSVWVGIGEGPAEVPAEFSDDPVMALVQFDRETGEILQTLDLHAYEVENNPDNAPETISNVVDLAFAADGTMYIVDASANALLSWTESDGLQVVTVWAPDETGAIPQAVPTSVVVTEDGDIYVGFLSGFPFPQGGARIEHWYDGELSETFEGLTLVTDIALDADGNLYAVQLSTGLGEAGFTPQSGSVVQVTADGITPIVEGLNFPYGLIQDQDGNWLVSVNSTFAEPGSGTVIVIPASDGM